MILALNIGNSNITFGGYTPDGKLVFSSRLFADTALSSDELLYKIVNMLALYGAEPQQITAVIFSSVVPALTPRLREALRKMCECQIMEVGPGLKSGVRIRMDNPAQLGGELLCAIVGALQRCTPPCVVVNFDTATTLLAVDSTGALVGGSILPGPQSSLSALVRTPAQLPTAEAAMQAELPAAQLAASNLKGAEKEAREREERIARARETARTHAGRLFGILTPGEPDILVAQAAAAAAGCRIERDGSLVKTGEGRGEPCFILPGHPALSVEQFKGGLGFMVRYGADGNGVDAMRMKLSALGPVSSYDTRGSINHFRQYAGMTVVETGHERHGSPVSFLFISKATFEKELERILQEKAEAEAEHRRENETLQKMF